ncbi:MAG: hypothetical protein M1833_003210 [Piccolia ochrophora]|nr:MAG: hypothetical protein M1833_003210 [Piccolia ochrophora]
MAGSDNAAEQAHSVLDESVHDNTDASAEKEFRLIRDLDTNAEDYEFEPDLGSDKEEEENKEEGLDDAIPSRRANQSQGALSMAFRQPAKWR